MAKKKREKPKRVITKRHLSHLEEQARRRRRFLFIGIGIIAAVGGIIGGGWYVNEYQPLQKTAIRVNDTEFSMSYYIDMLELDYSHSISGDVVQFVQQNELIRQEVAAQGLGVTASDVEISENLASYEPPLGKEYVDVGRANVLTDKLLSEHFDGQVPQTAEHNQVMAMFLDSEAQAQDVMGRISGGEDFAALAGELSLEDLTRLGSGDLGWHPAGILPVITGTSVVEDYALTAEVGVISDPLYDEGRTKQAGYWIIEVLERGEEADRVHVQAILLGSEVEAQDALSRLDAGEDFAALASELSQDMASRGEGGDMGWMASDELDVKFSDFIINSEIGETSQPIKDDRVKTLGGYWLVKVVDREADRQIDEVDREQLKRQVLDAWVGSLWDDPDNLVEDYLDSQTMLWAINKASANINIVR